MFKRKHKIEVVPESQYTDFSARLEEKSYATNKTLIGAAMVPLGVATGLVINRIASSPENYSTTVIPVSSPIIEPINVLAQAPVYAPTTISNPEMVPVGFVADSSLELLANVLDPVIQILVTLSFPVASVIMIGAFFFLMLGNSEKALGMISSAGLGYVLIQLSPLLLNVLREIGNAV